VVKNMLGVETDQNLVPQPYRAQHGDRVAIFGRWIVDAGHNDFHTEIHPPLLLATGRANSPNETKTTVIGRPYLVGQRWLSLSLFPPPAHVVSVGMIDHLLEEAGKIPLDSTQMEAHPQMMPKAWQG